MAMAACANCKNKVDEGAVRCASCGADLSRPGSFMQVIGFVTISASTIPFAIVAVAAQEKNLLPLFIGCGVLLAGIAMVVYGRARMKASPATVIQDPGVTSAPPQ
jgi:hypothetical protein